MNASWYVEFAAITSSLVSNGPSLPPELPFTPMLSFLAFIDMYREPLLFVVDPPSSSRPRVESFVILGPVVTFMG